MNDLSDLQSQFLGARSPRVSVVLAFRNAMDTVLERVADVAVEAEYSHINLCEIIVVDDASEDLTWAALQSLAWREPRLRPMRLRKCFGPEAAREAGALAATGDIVITLEPDAPVTDLGQLEGLIEADFDVVTGFRPSRSLAAKAVKRGSGLRQPLSGTAAYRREVLAALSESGAALAHLPFAARKLGYRVGEMELDAAPRKGSGLTGLAGVLGAMGAIYASERLLGYGVLLGLALVAAAFGVPLLTIGLDAAMGAAVPWGLLLGSAVALLFAGLNITGMAMLGSLVLARSRCRSRADNRVAETLQKHGARD